jgi:hypothetical protein
MKKHLTSWVRLHEVGVFTKGTKDVTYEIIASVLEISGNSTLT